jgi:superoxide dismutase, Fe-Mn family
MKQNKTILIAIICACFVFILLIMPLIKNKKEIINDLQSPNEPIPNFFSQQSILNYYKPKEFTITTGTKKLSTKQIKEHKELYKGYVNKRNEVEEALQTVDKSKANSTHSTFRALKIAQNFTRNAAVLHELYFENIGTGTTIGQETQKLLIQNFGSIDSFKEDLFATALAARGWAITCYNFDDQRVQNYLLDSHFEKVPILCIPLLVIDTYEHAYMIDFGINRKEYLALLWDNIDWNVVEERIKITLGHI